MKRWLLELAGVAVVSFVVTIFDDAHWWPGPGAVAGLFFLFGTSLGEALEHRSTWRRIGPHLEAASDGLDRLESNMGKASAKANESARLLRELSEAIQRAQPPDGDARR